MTKHTLFKLALGTAALCAAVPIFAQANATEVWRTVYDTPLNSEDEGKFVRCDASGNAYVVGIAHAQTQLTKYAPDGVVLWSRQFHYGFVYDMEIDSVGNPFILTRGAEYSVLRFNVSTGDLIWRQDLANAGTIPLDLEVDHSGNVVVAAQGATTASTDTIWLTKFNGDSGAQLWQKASTNPIGAGAAAPDPLLVDGASAIYLVRVNRAIALTPNGALKWVKDFATNQVAIAPDGDLISAASLANTGYMQVRRLDVATGAALWVKSYVQADDERPQGIVVGANGDVYVVNNAGATPTVEQNFTSMYRINGDTGNQIWRRTYPVAILNNPPEPEVDADGNLYVGFWTGDATNKTWHALKMAGVTGDPGFIRTIGTGAGKLMDICPTDTGLFLLGAATMGSNTDAVTLKIDLSTAKTIWSQTFRGYGGAQDDVFDSVLVGNTVFVAGTTGNPDKAMLEVSAFSAVTGKRLWTKLIKGSTPVYNLNYSKDEYAFIDADAQGNVMVLGRLQNAYLLAKISQAGTVMYRREVPASSDAFNVVDMFHFDVDANGDAVVAVGTSTNTKVVKQSGATGNILWTKNFANPSWVRVTTDANKDIFLVRTMNISGTSVEELLKLDGADGTIEWVKADPSGQTDPMAPNQITLGPVGNLLVAYGGSIASYMAVDGGKRWESFGTAFNAKFTFDQNGGLIAAGSAGTPQQDFLVREYNADTGAVAWNQTVPNPNWNGLVTGDVVVDGGGDVWVTGFEPPDADNPRQLRVLQLNSGNGGVITNTTIDVDRYAAGRTLVPTGSGAILAGTTVFDVLVMRLD